METQELFYPQIAAQAGPYTFEEGVEIELYSSQDSYFDWAKIRFTEEYQPEISVERKAPAMMETLRMSSRAMLLKGMTPAALPTR